MRIHIPGDKIKIQNIPRTYATDNIMFHAKYFLL